MSTELKDKIQEDLKKRNITPKSIIQTIKNSINGIICYAKDGKSIILYIIGLLAQVIMGIIFDIHGLEWIFITFVMGSLLAIELLNTSIEAVCDAISKEYNPLIKIAKDCGSAATFIMVIVLIILNLIIFIPKIFF